uniref:MICOS complex subunit MIC19 n=1 Tax=Panagrellus redivivus TaxID=6233 RepID=A0A7E4VB07_PANRE
MGAGESKPSDNKPKVVKIDRTEIPEAYKAVGVSDNVVKRVGGADHGQVTALKSQLDQEREENAKLREQMQNLSALQRRNVTGALPPPPGETLEDIEEKKRVFEETVQRVEKQFFNYQRENVCEANEKELVACLAKNKGKALNCQALKAPYDSCIVKFRNEVLAAKAN